MIKLFSHDEKQITAEELSELIINHMEFHGMDMEFYLPDPQDASKVCNILQEDSKYLPMWVIQYFKDNSSQHVNYSTNSMDFTYKAIMSIQNDLLKLSIVPYYPMI